MNNMMKNLLIWVVIGLVLMTVFNQFNSRQSAQAPMEYSQFIDEVKAGRIAKVTIEGRQLKATAIRLSKPESLDGLVRYLGSGLIDGIGPNDLRLDRLLGRAANGNVKEVILALSATVDGQTTAHYIAERLQSAGVPVTINQASGVITLPTDTLFALGRPDLEPDGWYSHTILITSMGFETPGWGTNSFEILCSSEDVAEDAHENLVSSRS